MRIAIVNAGPLIALGKLNHLGLIADLYPDFRVPDAVFREVVTEGMARGMAEALTVRLFLQHHGFPVVGVSEAALGTWSPPVTFGRGERQVLALARSLPGVRVLLDDEEARAEARRLGLPVLGTVGVLVRAHRSGALPFEELRLLLTEIAVRPDIWISAKLCRQVLAQLATGN